jgi:hypothetical protein
MKRALHIHALVLSLLFAGWIAAPLVYDTFRTTQDALISKSENRMLARRPVLKPTHADPFPMAYEKYYNDHFMLRYELIHLHSYLVSYLWFGKSPVPKEVVIGKDGWLFSGNTEREVYEGRYVPDVYAEGVVEKLHQRALWMQEAGIAFYIALVPMKCEVYPEFLPEDLTRCPGGTFTDLVTGMIRRDTLLNLIELKPGLLARKKQVPVFYRTDNHWNIDGAYQAYADIVTRIGRDFPAVRPIPFSALALRPDHGVPGNLATMAGLGAFLNETFIRGRIRDPKSETAPRYGYPIPKGFVYPSEYEMVFAHPDTTLPRILVIRDSFFAPLIPMMRESFGRSVFIFDRWMYGANRNIILREKPDIVLLEVFEPHLSNILTSRGPE